MHTVCRHSCSTVCSLCSYSCRIELRNIRVSLTLSSSVNRNTGRCQFSRKNSKTRARISKFIFQYFQTATLDNGAADAIRQFNNNIIFFKNRLIPFCFPNKQYRIYHESLAPCRRLQIPPAGLSAPGLGALIFMSRDRSIATDGCRANLTFRNLRRLLFPPRRRVKKTNRVNVKMELFH